MVGNVGVFEIAKSLRKVEVMRQVIMGGRVTKLRTLLIPYIAPKLPAEAGAFDGGFGAGTREISDR